MYRPIGATHPSLVTADLPPIIPLREFYASTDARWNYQLSPDRKNLSWLESKWFKPALWVKPLEGKSRTIFHTDDEVRWYAWSADSRYVLYQADRDGWGWKTRMKTYRKIEHFLAKHLGGRAYGFDYALLGAQTFP